MFEARSVNLRNDRKNGEITCSADISTVEITANDGFAKNSLFSVMRRKSSCVMDIKLYRMKREGIITANEKKDYKLHVHINWLSETAR